MQLLRDRGVRAFLLVWTGQVVSLLGSGLTAFALGVWIFQETRSATQYALVTFFVAAPPLVVLPLAGPLIDRWDRKRLLIACDLAGALATGAILLLAWRDSLSLPFACAIVALTSSATALQWPTHAATVTTLVPREHLGRASGMTHLAHATSQVLAPLLAGGLIAIVGLVGIAAIDLATFAFSTVLLLAASIPPRPVARTPARQGSTTDSGAQESSPRGGSEVRPRSYWGDVPFGLRFIFGHAGLAALLVMFALVNFLTEIAAVLFTPLVLTMATPAALGTILSIGGLGMMAGGALMSAWGGPRRTALGATLFAALSGAGVAMVGVTDSVLMLGTAAAVYFFCLPLMMGCSQVVWQRAVPADLQGRVFATRTAIAMSAVPLASLAAGPLADGVFEPLMAAGGGSPDVLGALVGTGPGRGIAAVVLVSGALSVTAALVAGLYGPLRRLDEVEVKGAAPAAAASVQSGAKA